MHTTAGVIRRNQNLTCSGWAGWDGGDFVRTPFCLCIHFSLPRQRCPQNRPPPMRPEGQRAGKDAQ